MIAECLLGKINSNAVVVKDVIQDSDDEPFPLDPRMAVDSDQCDAIFALLRQLISRPKNRPYLDDDRVANIFGM